MKKKVSGMKKKTNLIEEYNVELWSPATIEKFQADLLSWYDLHKRDLPWRRTKDPYKIWVSEIMLQQTQVQTVIPYYERFIDELPTVKDLAEVDESRLLKLWEGLGYYSRVKNMQAAAQQVMEEWGGQLPDNRQDLEKLKGIGPYTAGAIASIAFDQATPAIDGNAMRVFSRIFKIDADISKQKTRRLFDQLVGQIIDEKRPGDFNQAIMDVGSQKSMPKAYIEENNPVAPYDQSYQEGTWADYPVKKSKSKVKKEVYYAFIIQNDKGEYLFEKRPSTGLLADFLTFPLINQEEFLKEEAQALVSNSELEPLLSEKDYSLVQEELADHYQLSVDLNQQAIGHIQHIFSHRHWTVYAFEGSVEKVQLSTEEEQWIHPADFADHAFPKPQQKLIALYQEYIKSTNN